MLDFLNWLWPLDFNNDRSNKLNLSVMLWVFNECVWSCMNSDSCFKDNLTTECWVHTPYILQVLPLATCKDKGKTYDCGTFTCKTSATDVTFHNLLVIVFYLHRRSPTVQKVSVWIKIFYILLLFITKLF